MYPHATTIEDQIEECRLELELFKFERQQKLMAQKNEFQILRGKRDKIKEELAMAVNELDPSDVRVYVSAIREVRDDCEVPPVIVALEAQLLEALLHEKVLYKQLQLSTEQNKQFIRTMQGMLLRATDDKATNEFCLMNSMKNFFDNSFKKDTKDVYISKYTQEMNFSDGSMDSSPSLENTVDSEISAISNGEEQNVIMARISATLEIVVRANKIQSTRTRAIVRNAQLSRKILEAKQKQFLQSRNNSEELYYSQTSITSCH